MTLNELEARLRGAINEIKPVYVPGPTFSYELDTDVERIIIEFKKKPE